MNDQYQYSGQRLTPSIAQELIVELFAGETVQKQEIVRAAGAAHTERGGQLPTAGADHPVTHALSKMKQSGLAENPERGIWVMKPTRIKTLAEFMKWAKKFTPGDYVFRGIRNETYPIRASAYRRLKNDRNFERFLQINKDLIDETILRGYDERNGRQLSHLEMLAELQHHGAATCLIDFTYSAQIALWFACGQDSKTSQDCDSKPSKDCENPPNGKVFAVYNQLPDFKKVKSNMLKNDIDFFLQDEETSPLYYWQPRQQNNRIIAQQSIFLFGRPEFDADAECVILVDSKEDILTELKQVSLKRCFFLILKNSLLCVVWRSHTQDAVLMNIGNSLASDLIPANMMKPLLIIIGQLTKTPITQRHTTCGVSLSITTNNIRWLFQTLTSLSD